MAVNAAATVGYGLGQKRGANSDKEYEEGALGLTSSDEENEIVLELSGGEEDYGNSTTRRQVSPSKPRGLFRRRKNRMKRKEISFELKENSQVGEFIRDFNTPSQDLKRVKGFLKKNGIPTAVLNEGNGEMKNNTRCLINPTGIFRSRWDVLVILALAFTAIVTPFETAFLPTVLDALFFVNRLVDSIFILDIGFNFCTPVYSSSKNRMVWTHKEIAIEYAKFWLFIDVVSVIPFDIIGLLSENDDLSFLSGLSTIRLLRLAKLLRIFRASRILRRWESQLSVSHSKIQLARFAVGVIILAHWMACGFKLLQEIENTVPNWLTNYFDSDTPITLEVLSWESQYVVALYWAVKTITTIGYGDVVPVTDAERWYTIVAMFFGGSTYAYIIGSVCGIVSSMDEFETRFHQRIDHLNRYLRENEIPNAMRWKIREFFYNAKTLEKRKGAAHLLNDLSPEMQSQLALYVKAKALNRVPFLYLSPDGEKRVFVHALALEMKEAVFPALENIANPGDEAKSLMIVSKGVALLNRAFFISPQLVPNFSTQEDDTPQVKIEKILSSIKREVLSVGSCFGEEMILQNVQRRYHIVSLSYIELHVLTKQSLEKIFLKHNMLLRETRHQLRRYAIKLAFRKNALKAINQYRWEQEHGGPSPTNQEETQIERGAGNDRDSMVFVGNEENDASLEGISLKMNLILHRLKEANQKIELLENKEMQRVLEEEERGLDKKYTYVTALKAPPRFKRH